MPSFKSLIAIVAMFSFGTCRAETINLAAAVSLREAVTEAATSYEARTGDHVQFTFGASGQLASQVQNGAPVDAFISAANKQVDQLVDAGIADKASRRIVAGNGLVLVVPADAANPPKGFESLVDATVKKVAVGEPKTVPAGQYAMQVLDTLKLTESLRPRLVFGSNVRQVLDYVERGEVSAGIVYSTDAKQSGQKVKVIATAEASSHEPVVYPAVLIKGSAHQAAAGRFLEYLITGDGRAALIARGFTTPGLPATAPAK